mmetsp:Transcript_26905/g.47606  ORF Transcript_26905/g.47606 Transcript_26905/m.47606 type:complete len:241 (-) Transcript_26905:381-1103(-)
MVSVVVDVVLQVRIYVVLDLHRRPVAVGLASLVVFRAVLDNPFVAALRGLVVLFHEGLSDFQLPYRPLSVGHASQYGEDQKRLVALRDCKRRPRLAGVGFRLEALLHQLLHTLEILGPWQPLFALIGAAGLAFCVLGKRLVPLAKLADDFEAVVGLVVAARAGAARLHHLSCVLEHELGQLDKRPDDIGAVFVACAIFLSQKLYVVESNVGGLARFVGENVAEAQTLQGNVPVVLQPAKC